MTKLTNPHKMQDFRSRIYALLRTVPKGYVTTYKDLAHALGTKAYRAVGSAMAHNPDAPHTPCHRVVCSDGRVGNYTSADGTNNPAQKIAQLGAEGVDVVDGKVKDLDAKRFKFKEQQ